MKKRRTLGKSAKPYGAIEALVLAACPLLRHVPMTMKLAIAGAGGRMGRVLTRIIEETPGCSVAGGLEPKGSAACGQRHGFDGHHDFR